MAGHLIVLYTRSFLMFLHQFSYYFNTYSFPPQVRLNIRESRIIPDDFRFSKSTGKKVPYGTAGDCFSSNRGNCRRGSFHIDLTGTELRLQSSVTWSVVGKPRGIQIQDFQMGHGDQIASAKCGGSCAKCQPTGGLLVEQLRCGE